MNDYETINQRLIKESKRSHDLANQCQVLLSRNEIMKATLELISISVTIDAAKMLATDTLNRVAGVDK